MSTPQFALRYEPWAVVAAASEGIGESFSRQIAAAGINLVLVARRPDPLNALASSLRCVSMTNRSRKLSTSSD